MSKFFTKVKSTASKVSKKVLAAVCSASIAVSAIAVNAFAEESSSGGVDISAVTTSLQSNLTELATKAAVACAAVVGAGLTIFGLKWVVQKIIGFFKVIGK